MGVRGKEKVYRHQEFDLVAAILRQAVTDAQGRGIYDPRCLSAHALVVHEARMFLYDQARIAFFATLCGADIENLQAQLLTAAGMTGHEVSLMTESLP